MPVEASACSVVYSAIDRTHAAEWRRAREAVKNADVMMDAEVIRPFIRGKQTALLKAHRIFKGPSQETFEVDAPDSCALEFDREGERSRVFLRNGPGAYVAWDTGLNWQVDKLLGSDRRKDWPFVAGN